MSMNEQELCRRLEDVAAQASPPRFTIESLVGRIRRRRARIIAAVAGALLIVAAVAVAVPIGLSGPSQPTAAPAHPSMLPFRLRFTVAVNYGRSMVTPRYAGSWPLPSFAVAPGQNLAINVAVTVPAHATVTAMWLGITEGGYSLGATGRPTGLSPVLAHSHRPLTPGLHVFRMRWTAPAGIRPGTSGQLTVTWSAHGFAVGQSIAELVTRR